MKLMIFKDKNKYLDSMFNNYNYKNNINYLNTDILLSLIYETNVFCINPDGLVKVKTQDNKILDTFDNEGWEKLLKENKIAAIGKNLPIIVIQANEQLEKKFMLLLDKLEIEYEVLIESEHERKKQHIRSAISELFED